jgi:hypothetical protein
MTMKSTKILLSIFCIVLFVVLAGCNSRIPIELYPTKFHLIDKEQKSVSEALVYYIDPFSGEIIQNRTDKNGDVMFMMNRSKEYTISVSIEQDKKSFSKPIIPNDTDYILHLTPMSTPVPTPTRFWGILPTDMNDLNNWLNSGSKEVYSGSNWIQEHIF